MAAMDHVLHLAKTIGAPGQWHRPTDTIENVDPVVVARTEAFLCRLLGEIDKEGLLQNTERRNR